MKLYYCPWNCDPEKTREIMEAVRDLKPFNDVFDGTILKEDAELPASGEEIYDAARIARKNALDLSTGRLAVITTETLFHIGMPSTVLWAVMTGDIHLYGAGFRNEGVCFARPIRHEAVEAGKKDIDLQYGVELAAHELGVTLIWGGYEHCSDRRCFVYGKMQTTDDGGIPPYGRDHFCATHSDMILNNAEIFRGGGRPL
ncbi:MAG: hypothetical protein HY512_03470 [Candidatus Aenigmarchaeota archaeon]|nr:hypothetical protein [Candidatus Aenigmarchaeota archaeon]